MPNFAEEIADKAGEEPIEAIVVGAQGWGTYEERERKAPVPERGKVCSWEEARPALDYEYDDGFGGAECDAIWAWTPTRVIFVSTYDGSTTLESVPRNPQDGDPDMPGGG